MTKTTSILWIAAALTMSAVPAAAQTTKNIFVDVNVGVQAASRTFVVEATPIVYDETAILSTSHKVGSGVLFDVSGGYRVWRDLSIALGYNYAGGSADAADDGGGAPPAVSRSARGDDGHGGWCEALGKRLSPAGRLDHARDRQDGRVLLVRSLFHPCEPGRW